MKSTKDNWIKAFENTRLVKMGGMCFECCDYEDMVDDMKAFISQVEKDAEERGYQLGLRDGIKKEHEKSESWTELNKQGVINTHNLIKDAIEKTKQEIYSSDKNWRQSLAMAREKGYLEGVEKTNKRWREKCENLKLEYERKYLKPWPLNDYGKGRIDALSDLLEDE